jgi:hypothetical protein
LPIGSTVPIDCLDYGDSPAFTLFYNADDDGTNNKFGYMKIDYFGSMSHKTVLTNHILKLGKNLDNLVLAGHKFDHIESIFQYSFTSDLVPYMEQISFYNVTELSRAAFNNQSSLSTVTFDDTFKYFGAKMDQPYTTVFQNCRSLKYVYFESTNPPQCIDSDGNETM